MTSQNSIHIDSFLATRDQTVLIDVRSPAEFEKGHIVGAVSLPLFDNEERATVGTLYKQTSKDAALLTGLDIVGPKMRHFVEQAKTISQGKPIFCYCWRGGQRSASMAWLLTQAGMSVTTLQGGYKSYRKVMLENINNPDNRFVVLSGKTGCGKTLMLQELKKRGEQVVDLEGIANHKGSSFGSILEQPQPTNEQFENLLGEAFSKLNVNRRIWIENESRLIGKIHLQQGLWEKKETSSLINVDIPLSDRLQLLENMYGSADKIELIEAFNRIGKRIGGAALSDAAEFVRAGELQAAANVALRYYDKSYEYLLENKTGARVFHLPLDKLLPASNAAQLIAFADRHEL